ncbi:pepsin-2B-like isoform X2 [Cimex lectularius]|uniref:Peptidase A1 domain-containing protein n=1 Tax=Cimex lectularius TaxID=79782 RepID=A0A8I6SG08_CIMLE|nr:pepsin-2B-like isoform X2 [Cimex lectularius]
MKPYLLLVFIFWPVFCQSAIRIPLKKFPTEHNRISSYKEHSKWKREEPGKNKLPATYGLVGVGTPIQFIPILFDTFSNEIWLFNNECTSEICLITKPYNPSSSNTSKIWRIEYKQSYKNLNMYGQYTVDTFLLGDFILDKLEFVNIRRIEWKGTVERLSLETFAGQITLRFPAKTRGTDFMAKLFSRDLIEGKSFGLRLPSFNDGDGRGELIIGDWDRQYVNESLIDWIKVISDSYWEIIADKLVYGSYGLAEQADMVVDTGLSIIVGPQVIVNNLFKSIGNSVNIIPITITSFLSDYDGYAAKCSESLSNFDFLINDRHYVLMPKDYLLPIEGKEGWCAFGIAMANNNYTRSWRLGDVFLSKYYTVCDGNLSRLSFNDYLARNNQTRFSAGNFVSLLEI